MQDGTAYFALETGSVTGIVTRCAPEQPAASVRYGGEDRYFTFVPGAGGAAYLRWLKDSFGILWENVPYALQHIRHVMNRNQLCIAPP